jgi:riboflavin kinase/FMN adenylyltransferase
MRVVYTLTKFRPQNIKPAVALGIFDGLHRGHQRIITKLIREARSLKTISLVVTFFPHPRKEKVLYPLSYRLQLLEEAGVDLCMVIRFSSSFRKITASEFLRNILIKKINPKVVIIGRNFTFGSNARGDWRMLKDYSKKMGFKLRVIDVLTSRGKPISSSYIRSLIKRGKLLQSQELLGHPVSIFGRVTPGFRLGKMLGYPTANVNPDHEILLPFGVYAVRVRLENRCLAGICYIGNKPTIGINNKINIEVHIFGIKKNLYGRKIQIDFIKRLRAQKRFSSLQALASQINRDIRLCLQQVKYC